jgi:hypothetical protein
MTYTMKALGCDLPQRLRDLLKTIHEMNEARYVADAKMHEMGAVAMDENWDVCRSHIDCITGEIAKVISDGIVAGEFQVSDAGLAAAKGMDPDATCEPFWWISVH